MAEDIPVTGPGSAAPPHADYNAAAARLGYPSYVGVPPASAQRVSWGAIFAGTVVALVVELMLGTLGLAVALGNIHPATETRTFEGMGVGAGIWFVVTTLVALYAGGWTAGRLAGIPRRADALLHGVVTWGLVTLFSTWLFSNLVSGVVGGAVSAVGATLGAVHLKSNADRDPRDANHPPRLGGGDAGGVSRRYGIAVHPSRSHSRPRSSKLRRRHPPLPITEGLPRGGALRPL